MSSDVELSRLKVYEAVFTDQILGLQLEMLGGVIVVCGKIDSPNFFLFIFFSNFLSFFTYSLS